MLFYVVVLLPSFIRTYEHHNTIKAGGYSSEGKGSFAKRRVGLLVPDADWVCLKSTSTPVYHNIRTKELTFVKPTNVPIAEIHQFTKDGIHHMRPTVISLQISGGRDSC